MSCFLKRPYTARSGMRFNVFSSISKVTNAWMEFTDTSIFNVTYAWMEFTDKIYGTAALQQCAAKCI